MEHPEPQAERRTFLKFLIHGLSAVFTVVLGAPVVAYLIDPLNRPKPPSGFRPVDGIRLSELSPGQPRQGVIRNVRHDAWALHPNDVVGRVWVVKEQNDDIKVFTTVCPHLGCSINAAPPIFVCPCHGAKFDMKGEVVKEGNNPAPRGMDSLDWQRDADRPDSILVKYENFKQLEDQKIPRT